VKPQVIIRADASATIGWGHVSRTLALGAMLQPTFQVSLFSKDLPEGLARWAQQYDITHRAITTEEEFVESLQPGVAVIMDGYHFTQADQERVRAKGTFLVMLDDIPRQDLSADVVLNTAPGITPADYPQYAAEQLWLGPEYALLHPPYFLPRPTPYKGTEFPTRWVICFGGSDQLDLTATFMEWLYPQPEVASIVAIVGGSYQQYPALVERGARLGEKVTVHQGLSGSEMASQFQSAEAAIVSASSLVFEALASGPLVLAGHYVPNQRRLYEGFAAQEAIIPLGAIPDLQPIDFSVLLSQLREPAFRQKHLTHARHSLDGKSATRLLEGIGRVLNRSRT